MATSTELTCSTCGDSKTVDVEIVDGTPLLVWWEQRGRRCTDCVKSGTGITLARARDRLQGGLALGKGTQCPCCDQLAKVYQRTMLPASALALYWAWRDHGMDPFHMPTVMQTRVPTLAHQGGTATLGAYWGFIAESREPREDGGRAGWWQLTDDGRAYVQGRAFVKHVYTYNAKVLRTSGEPRTIQDALGERFDLAVMMAS
ncbi:MAG: hypothetical protein ABIQ39_05935 [Ilumatobacteraceae bacterium]